MTFKNMKMSDDLAVIILSSILFITYFYKFGQS